MISNAFIHSRLLLTKENSVERLQPAADTECMNNNSERDAAGLQHRHAGEADAKCVSRTKVSALLYLWIDGEGFMRLAHTQEVIDDLLHSKVQSFLQRQTKRLTLTHSYHMVYSMV